MFLGLHELSRPQENEGAQEKETQTGLFSRRVDEKQYQPNFFGRLAQLFMDSGADLPDASAPKQPINGSTLYDTPEFSEVTPLPTPAPTAPTAPVAEAEPAAEPEVEVAEEEETEAPAAGGLMSPQPEAQAEEEQPAAAEEETTFAQSVADFESDHGDTPVPTNDAREAHLAVSQRSKDVGYGHKVTAAEERAGTIHGIRFKNAQGQYIALTDAQKMTILEADLDAQVGFARTSGWDTKLANINSSWDDLDDDYKDVLTSLAFNVGGNKAGQQWTLVLTAARDENVVNFARHIRRQDNGQNTAGMDNRAMKELFAAGLIDNRSDVSSVLPLANAASGVPE
jgi:GH24 family phage-related lysozyme (muramidase)